MTYNRTQAIKNTFATKSDGKTTRIVNVADLIAKKSLKMTIDAVNAEAIPNADL